MSQLGKKYSFMDTGLKPFPQNRDIVFYVKECFNMEITFMYEQGYKNFFVRTDTPAGANFAIIVAKLKKDKPDIRLTGISAYPDFFKLYSPSIRKLIKKAVSLCDNHMMQSMFYIDRVYTDINTFISTLSENTTDYSKMKFKYINPNDKENIIEF